MDRQLRNAGIPPGRIVVIGGPPFAGKTTIASEMALNMSTFVPVYALFSDEGRTQAAVRVAVMLGIKLEDVDKDPIAASERMVELLGERSIYLLKPDTEQSYAENVVAYAVSRGAPRGTVIVLDSVQTILAFKPDDDAQPDSPRIAAKKLVTACRNWADAHGFVFILTSQANRSFYRSKKDDENANAIAAFSESGAIEYMADVAIVLSLPDEKSEIVKVRFVKNRLKGSAKPFALRYSADTGRLVEVDGDTIASAELIDLQERLAPIKSLCLVTLERHDGLTTSQLAELTNRRKADCVAAVQSLESEKRAYWKKEGRAILWFSVAGR